jgi:hypothetical protein
MFGSTPLDKRSLVEKAPASTFEWRLSPDMSSAAPYRYKVYGLSVSSELALPDLHEDEDPRHTDVNIRVAAVRDFDGLGMTFDADGVVLRIADVASYLIREGREIVVDPRPAASARNVRLYLLGSAMGVLLHQKGFLPLHANAVEIEGRAVAFMGPAGAGKSTLAAWLHDAGHRLIADDVCVLQFDEDGSPAYVHAGLPRIRLWKDALERAGRNPANFELSYSGDEHYEKFDVPIPPKDSVGDQLDLVAVYVLSTGERFDITALMGVDSVEAVFSNTYRGFVVSELGQNKLHFDAALRLVRSTPIFRLARSRRVEDMVADVPRIVAHAKEVIGASRNSLQATSRPRG